MLKGSLVALVTPFRGDRIDEKKLQELVEWHIAEGTNGLVPVGTTGEASTLSAKEHARVIEIVVKAARQRVPVVAGTGSNSTSEAIELTQVAKELGVDGVLMANPYYNRPTQEGLKAHFLAVASAVSIPIVLYNIPSRTGVNMLPATVAALAESNRNIVGIKEASGSIDQTSEIIQKLGDRFAVVSGDDSLTLPLMAVGAKGVISVVANLVPKAVSELCGLCLDNRFDEARKAHLKLYPLTKAMFVETNPAPIKAAMFEVGLVEDEHLRLPLVSVTEDSRRQIKNALKQYGVRVPSISK